LYNFEDGGSYSCKVSKMSVCHPKLHSKFKGDPVPALLHEM